MTDEGDVVSDTNTASVQQDGSIGIEIINSAVWSLYKCKEAYVAVNPLGSALVKYIREASPATSDQRNGLLVRRQHILLRGDQSLLVYGERFVLAPCNAERMESPQSHGRNTQKEVLSRAESPWASQLQCDFCSITWKDFNLRRSSAAEQVAVKVDVEAGKSL